MMFALYVRLVSHVVSHFVFFFVISFSCFHFWFFVVFCFLIFCFFFFFFSSRRRHTRCGRDWSSDVCSSDLACAAAFRKASRRCSTRVRCRRISCAMSRASLATSPKPPGRSCRSARPARRKSDSRRGPRSEERRVGKECRSRWAGSADEERSC